MIVLELFVLLLKIPPVLVRNYGQDWKWVQGWVVKAIGHLVRVQNGKVIRRHQDQTCRHTERFSATTVNSPEQMNLCCLLQQVYLFPLHLQFLYIVTHREHAAFWLDYMNLFTSDSNCQAYSFFLVSCVFIYYFVLTCRVHFLRGEDM